MRIRLHSVSGPFWSISLLAVTQSGEVTGGCRFVYEYCTPHQRLLGDQMGGACSADGTDDKGIPSFRQKT
jgi:hypothetical protein